MVLRKWGVVISLAVQLTVAGAVWGATPLLTDDAVTLGTGNGQFEVCGRWGTDRDWISGVLTKGTQSSLTTSLTYGVANPLDLAFEFSREWGEVEQQGVTSKDPEAANFKLSAKLRLFEAGDLSVAVRPDLGYSYVPAGSSHDRTLSYGGVLIVITTANK